MPSLDTDFINSVTSEFSLTQVKEKALNAACTEIQRSVKNGYLRARWNLTKAMFLIGDDLITKGIIAQVLTKDCELVVDLCFAPSVCAAILRHQCHEKIGSLMLLGSTPCIVRKVHTGTNHEAYLEVTIPGTPEESKVKLADLSELPMSGARPSGLPDDVLKQMKNWNFDNETFSRSREPIGGFPLSKMARAYALSKGDDAPGFHFLQTLILGDMQMSHERAEKEKSLEAIGSLY